MKKSVRDKRFESLVELGCIACLIDGNYRSLAVIHHCTGTSYRGIGQKASDEETIPLCPYHHRDVHLRKEEFELRYSTQAQLLEKVNGYISDPDTLPRGWWESWNI